MSDQPEPDTAEAVEEQLAFDVADFPAASPAPSRRC